MTQLGASSHNMTKESSGDRWRFPVHHAHAHQIGSAVPQSYFLYLSKVRMKFSFPVVSSTENMLYVCSDIQKIFGYFFQ